MHAVIKAVVLFLQDQLIQEGKWPLPLVGMSQSFSWYLPPNSLASSSLWAGDGGGLDICSEITYELLRLEFESWLFYKLPSFLYIG